MDLAGVCRLELWRLPVRLPASRSHSADILSRLSAIILNLLFFLLSSVTAFLNALTAFPISFLIIGFEVVAGTGGPAGREEGVVGVTRVDYLYLCYLYLDKLD
jgi:hypothetical protein